MERLKRVVPLLVVLAAIFVLGYPVAFLLGYPQATNNLENRSRWSQRVVEAHPPRDLSDPTTLRFDRTLDPDEGLAVYNRAPLAVDYRVEGDALHLAEAMELITLNEIVGSTDGNRRVFRVDVAGAGQPLYLNGRRLDPGYEVPPEKPDGDRTTFTFTGSDGAFILRGELLHPDQDYTMDGNTLVLDEPPPQWLQLRTEPDWARPLRVTGDYAWADDHTLVFQEPPPDGGTIELAEDVVRWARRLIGPIDGENRAFRFPQGEVVPGDVSRRVFVDDLLLTTDGRTPQETTDGERVRFTFPEAEGLITLNGELLTPGTDFERDGSVIALAEPPARRSALRQHDYLVTDSEQGTMRLATAPEPGSQVWSSRYRIYDQPRCGTTVVECFLNLPQPPVPLPHWIVTRAPDYITRYPFQSHQNVVRSSLYTAQGTLLALLLGGAIGLLLAILFVFIRPLEKALFPWVIASQTVPIIALVPMLVLILANLGVTIQTSLLPSALIGAYLSFFPITVGATKGLRSVDPLKLDLMRSYAANRWQVFFKLRIYEAMPLLFTNFKVGAAASLIGVLVSETETSNAKGLGYAIVGQVQAGSATDLWILFLVSALMGILFVSAVGWVERLVAPWVRKA